MVHDFKYALDFIGTKSFMIFKSESSFIEKLFEQTQVMKTKSTSIVHFHMSVTH